MSEIQIAEIKRLSDEVQFWKNEYLSKVEEISQFKEGIKEVSELADTLADEAYGDKGVYLYSERQDLSKRLHDILVKALSLSKEPLSEIEAVKKAMDMFPEKVKEYREGKTGLLGQFVGEAMKIGKGQFDPKELHLITKKLLDSKEQGSEAVEFGTRTFRNVQMAAKVELILKPEFLNSGFTWHQIQDAIMQDDPKNNEEKCMQDCESCGKDFDIETMIEGQQWFCKPCYDALSKDDEFMEEKGL